MWFWFFILLCDCLIPFIMIIAGRMMWRHCPKNINGLVGYRTSMSMKNMDTWKFAHEYAGKLWWKIGWIMLVSTVLVHIPFYRANEDVIGSLSMVVVIIQTALLVGSVIPTELALRKHFNKDGTRLEADVNQKTGSGFF